MAGIVTTQELNKRLSDFLDLLISNPKGVPFDEVAASLKINKRTLYYDLNKANHWLTDHKLGFITMYDRNLVLVNADPQTLMKQIENTQYYHFTKAERMVLEFFLIALRARVTLPEICTFLSVSRNTVLNDISGLREELAEFSISLNSSVKRGYFFEGNESVIRKFMTRSVQSLSSKNLRNRLNEIIQVSLFELTENDLDFFELSRCVIRQYEKDIDCEIAKEDVDSECILILISWIRAIKGFVYQYNIEEQQTLFNTPHYKSIALSLFKLSYQNLIVPDNEIYYIAPLFLGTKTSDIFTEAEENKYIESLAHNLVRSFEQVALITFTDRERLENRLKYHIKPLYYRLKYGLESSNVLVEQIKSLYRLIYNFTERAIRQIPGKDLEVNSESEIASLCIHFASQLNEKRLVLNQVKDKDKILIVGNADTSITLLLQDQLDKLLGRTFEYETAPASQIKEWMAKDYAMVISPNQIRGLPKLKNMVFAGPIINTEEQKKIIKKVEGLGLLPQYSFLLEQIFDKIKVYSGIDLKDETLYLELYKLMSHQKINENLPVNSVSLSEKIQNGEYWITDHTLTLSELLSLGCAGLQNGAGYQRLMSRLEKLFKHDKQKVIQVHPDAVLIHVPMQGDPFAEVDMSLVWTKERFTFPNGSSGHLIIFFSTVDNYSHWVALDNLYTFIESNPDFINSLPIHRKDLSACQT